MNPSRLLRLWFRLAWRARISAEDEFRSSWPDCDIADLPEVREHMAKAPDVKNGPT